MGVIDALEQELGFAVLTADQVLFWHALHLAGAAGAAHGITGYGRLSAAEPPGVPPDGHVALFVTDEGDARRDPLVRRRDDGTSVHGMVLYRGAPRRVPNASPASGATPTPWRTTCPHRVRGHPNRHPM
ncbi:hypothetical protein SAMN05216533_1331 [Streptomyces sp. Ag109_O5-10]|nr:hypothetical protein SAMN05216533_1331 [Streptomyces sp. Ag109_O5-10]